jgi:gamma-glutamylputrescine oxidase
MLSYWEKTELLSNPNYAIIGSGIVGISTALELRKRDSNASITIFERGALPWGASTKNAGFACFGSPSELLSDLSINSPSAVAALVEMRFLGLQKLLTRCGTDAIDYYNWGSNELFFAEDNTTYTQCLEKLDELNALLYPIVDMNVFELNDKSISEFGFSNVSHLIKNKAEGQINTGKMMRKLIDLAQENNIKIVNGIELMQYEETSNAVHLNFSDGIELMSNYLIITNNGFAKKLLPQLDVKPARAQVLITKPIQDLKVKGTFHFDEGYYYFRNIDNRVLFGGGRNLDFNGETTVDMNVTEGIQNQLYEYLQTRILPSTPFEIDQQWAGIMGIGTNKKPFVQQISPKVYCGVKMGGMGVAIGSMIGEELAKLILGE